MNPMYLAYQMAQASECTKTKVGACVSLCYSWERDGYAEYLYFLGYNKSPHAPNRCPRIVIKAGFSEKYELCEEVCGQRRHAEDMAIESMLKYIVDSENLPMTVGDDDDIVAVSDYIKKCLDKSDGNGYSSLWCYVYGHETICDDCLNRLKMLGFQRVLLCSNCWDLYNESSWREIKLR